MGVKKKAVAMIKKTALFLKETIQKTISKALKIIKIGKPNDKKLK